jgi:hypothetical protein
MLRKTNVPVVTVDLVVIPFRNVSFKHCVTENPQTITQNSSDGRRDFFPLMRCEMFREKECCILIEAVLSRL